MNSNKLTKKEQSRNKMLMEDIIRYCIKHEIFIDINIYTNGHLFSSENKPASVPVSIGKATYYDCGECNVSTIIEYSNPKTVTMTFEGPLYDAYNGYNQYNNAEADITNIAKKYQLYPEQGYAWSLSFYEI